MPEVPDVEVVALAGPSEDRTVAVPVEDAENFSNRPNMNKSDTKVISPKDLRPLPKAGPEGVL